jgi:NADH-quinone oxidoreductase subunit G
MLFYIIVNRIKILVNSNLSVLEACLLIGINIPRFCYHDTLSVAGNCRMCLIEIENSLKPVASCAIPVVNNLSIYTDTPLVKKARENLLEILLINHPLDCPICDQAGECDLQDQTKKYGSSYNRFFIKKRSVEDKILGGFIKTIMTRCIHCTRCVRFSDEVAGSYSLGTFNRGGLTEIGSYIKNNFVTELSGNVIDLCPVGALTSKPYAFKVRPWELRFQDTYDHVDILSCSPIQVHLKDNNIVRIEPKIDSTTNFITDKTRFSYDFLNNNRIKKFFIKKKIFLESITYSTALDFIKNIFQTKNNSNIFLINNLVDLDFLSLLKLVELKNSNVKSYSFNESENFYFEDNTNTELLSLSIPSIVLMIGTNLKTEYSLLNFKIRSKYYTNNFKNIYSGFYNCNFPSQYINININYILNIFEGKTKMSKYLSDFKIPFIILGSNLSKRFNYLIYSNILKNLIPTSVLFDIRRNISFLNLLFLNKLTISGKKLKNFKNIFSLNLEDNILNRKILKNKNFFWLNTHGSDIASNALGVFPTLSFFENENLFLNNQNFFKKTKIIVENSLKDIKFLLLDFNFSFKKRNFNFFHYYFEVLKIKNKFNFKCFLYSNTFFVSKYPVKSFLENSVFSNVYTKNSNNLLKLGQNIKKIFYFN